MATYVMSDIHGCYDEFIALLEKIAFNHQHDQLYLVGDLINRGPKSLAVMEYLMAHESSIFPVLGNHDLSYLVYAAGETKLRRGDTYDELLQSPHAKKIRNYLKKQPLMRYLEKEDIAIAHAGIPPFWTIPQARKRSERIHKKLTTESKEKYQRLMKEMFGNTPSAWSDSLEGIDKTRAIINYFCRMRFLHLDLSMDFDNKRDDYDDKIMRPWFKFDRSQHHATKIIYGHWASLGIHSENNTLCIDSGCVWEGELSVVRIDQPQWELTSFSF